MVKPKVLIITGSVGVGKSSVADAISEILRKSEERHAVVDMDYLRYVYPRPKGDPFSRALAAKGLVALWKNYEELGVRKVIISNVVENKADIDDIAKAIPNSNISVAMLVADLSTIHARLHERHAKRNPENLKWHINRAEVLTKQLEQADLGDFIIDTNNKSLGDIAHEVLAKWASSEASRVS